MLLGGDAVGSASSTSSGKSIVLDTFCHLSFFEVQCAIIKVTEGWLDAAAYVVCHETDGACRSDRDQVTVTDATALSDAILDVLW